MSLIALIQKFGSLKNVPAAELSALGYTLVKKDGAIHLKRIGAQEQPSKTVLLLAERYGLATRTFEALSGPYLEKFSSTKTPANVSEDDDMDEVNFDSAGRWANYVRAWATSELAMFRTRDQAHSQTVDALAGLGIKTDIWMSHPSRWHVDVASGNALSENERLQRMLVEFRPAIKEFLENELLKPESCILELASRLKVKAERERISAAIMDESSLRLAVSVCLKRAEQKRALTERSHYNGLFHLRKIQERLSRRQKHEEGTYMIALSKKDPFRDLTLGNDAGCCIGIYPKDEGGEFGSGHGASTMPLYLTDAATQFVEIHSPSERIGMAMMYAGYDGQRTPTLIVNSLELNRKAESAAHVLSDAVHGWILEFGSQAGFKRFVVGDTGYNTGTQYGKMSDLKAELVGGIRKVHFLGADPYSDVLEPGSDEDMYVESVVELDPKLFLSSGMESVEQLHTKQILDLAREASSDLISLGAFGKGYDLSGSRIPGLDEDSVKLADLYFAGVREICETGHKTACLATPRARFGLEGTWAEVEKAMRIAVEAGDVCLYLMTVYPLPEPVIPHPLHDLERRGWSAEPYYELVVMLWLLRNAGHEVGGRRLSYLDDDEWFDDDVDVRRYDKVMPRALIERWDGYGELYGTLVTDEKGYQFLPYVFTPLDYLSLYLGQLSKQT